MVITPYGLEESLTEIPQDIAGAGIRGLVDLSPAIKEFAESKKVVSLVQSVLGKEPTLVRSVLFSKSLDINWLVSWHQDLSITVNGNVVAQGFRNWSTKKGISHVQPPESFLEQMLTVRLHLDHATASNGALQVVPSSHTQGRIPVAQAAGIANASKSVTCSAKPGDLLLFKPLVLHSSAKATQDSPRRVVHLEYSVAELPRGLAWNRAA